jgi:hypothetical protein
MVRKAETFPPVTMGHIRGHDCRGLGRLQQDRRIFSVDAALTEEEIGFLQELVDAGELGRTITGLKSRAGLLRLMQLKYVTEHGGAGAWVTLSPTSRLHYALPSNECPYAFRAVNGCTRSSLTASGCEAGGLMRFTFWR